MNIYHRAKEKVHPLIVAFGPNSSSPRNATPPITIHRGSGRGNAAVPPRPTNSQSFPPPAYSLLIDYVRVVVVVVVAKACLAWLPSFPLSPKHSDVGGDGNGQPRIQAWNERGAGSGIEGGKFWAGLGWGPSVGGTARWEKTSGKINQQLLLFLPFPFSSSRSKTNLEKFPGQREGGGNCSFTLARHNNGPKLLCP